MPFRRMPPTALLKRLPAATGLLRLAPGVALVAALLGCATPKPDRVQPGQAEPELLAAMGAPTGRYPLVDGTQRLEFAQGPLGVRTWMVDLDAQGKVLRIRQVMDSHYFDQVQDGMSRDALLRLLGRPASRQGEWQNRETWSWRYANYDCLWVRVTLDASGKVWGGASTLPDPACDARL